MKTLILTFLVFMFNPLLNPGYAEEAVTCEQEQLQEEVKDDGLVYLSVDSVEVSSFDVTPDWAPLPEPNAVIDGDIYSRWSSNYIDDQWVSLDFGKVKTLSKLIIFWEAAYAVDYDILGSVNKEDWQLLLSLNDQKGGIAEISLDEVKVRYVKILGKKRFNLDWGISIWEVVCLGPVNENEMERPLSAVYPKIARSLDGQQTQKVELEVEKPVVSPGALTVKEFQKGVVYTSWSRNELESEISDKTLEYLKEIGVRHLTIMIVWLQETIEETEILPDLNDTPEDKALVHAINKAHSLGMKVALKPHVDVRTGEWRGDIIPSEEWFVSYKDYIMRYAQFAQKYNVELYSIGTELLNVTLPKWNSRWESLINDVRKVYSGLLVYGANWDEYQTIEFWDKVDFVGISAYFPLTDSNDPAKEELIAAWKKNALDIDNWLKKKKINKPVIFTELGYCSADGTNKQPWSVMTNMSEKYLDEAEQADCLDAMMTVCTTFPWFKGVYWWNYFPKIVWSPVGYTIRGKEAENVLNCWLNKI